MTILLFIIAVIFFLLIAWTHFLGAPWVPTSKSSVRKMLEIAKVKKGDVIYDLGSGDGRVIIEAARHFGVKAVGIEIDPFRYIITKIKIRILHLQEDVKVIWGNFFKHDISNADVIIVYLSQDANMKLSKKLVLELKPGVRIISHVFPFFCFEEVKTGVDLPIYLYKT